MQQYGYEQNTDKKETLVFFRGPEASLHTRAAFLSRGTAAGRVVQEARYLGPKLHHLLGASQECHRRAEAARKAYYSLGKFWHSEAPFDLK
eukprot:195283-Lingulodinium_polyedra.AAC.1